MWDKVVKNLPQYPSAVLTGIDAEGYPYSLRCVPQLDNTRQALRLELPPSAALRPGPASILCHYHNELLWGLKNFVLRGTLEQGDKHWVFHPTQFINGAGDNMGVIQLIRNGRHAAKQYLTKRQLERPRIPWDKIHQLYKDAQGK
jgi:hypothetical protein